MIDFCFFRPKTAYEMRISDWSSDVCSSDLGCGVASWAWAAGHASAASRARAGSLFIGTPSCKALVGCQLKRGARRAVDMNAVFSQRDAPGGEPAHGFHQQRVLALEHPRGRSEETRVGKECGSTCSSRWTPSH